MKGHQYKWLKKYFKTDIAKYGDKKISDGWSIPIELECKDGYQTNDEYSLHRNNAIVELHRSRHDENGNFIRVAEVKENEKW